MATSIDKAYDIINEWLNDEVLDPDVLAAMIAAAIDAAVQDAIDTIELRDMARQSGQSAFRGPQ